MKKPVIVYVMAACFMLAPLASAIMSMKNFGGDIPWTDRIWLLFTFAAGASLMIPRKATWLLGVGALVIASIFNLLNGLVSLELGRGLGPVTTAFLFFGNLGLAALLFHFRYPYLDRRDSWWGFHPRFACELPVKGDGFSGRSLNISYSGALLEISQPALGAAREIRFSLGDIQDLTAKIIRESGGHYGVKFSLTGNQRVQLKRLIDDLKLSPIGENSPVKS